MVITNGLIKAVANPVMRQLGLQFVTKGFENGLLYQELGPSRTNLTLVEPNGINYVFNCGVQVCIFKNDYRTFPTKFLNEDFLTLIFESKFQLTREIFFPDPAMACLRIFPISVEPVKATLSTSGWVAKTCPMAPPPVTTLKTPGGRPASAQISANRRAESLVTVAGFKTTVFPIANAGATFQIKSIKGN